MCVYKCTCEYIRTYIYMIVLIYVFSIQYYSDANAADSWMKEKEPLVISEDYGHDEASANVRLHACMWGRFQCTSL